MAEGRPARNPGGRYPSGGRYTVSDRLLARGDMRAALHAHDFAAAFKLMRQYDQATQDRIAGAVDGFGQPRVSRIMRGDEHVQSLEVVERIADGLRIPGAFLRIARRPWESDPSVQPGADLAVPAAPGALGAPGAPGAPGASGTSGTPGTPAAPPGEPAAPGATVPSAGGLVVDDEAAELRYDHGTYFAHQRRRIANVGSEPVTRYLIRISVDRFPGDPERSARLYRANPLRWDELDLTARCGPDEMAWQVKTDWDALKEVWLLFENARGRFPLYPGDVTTIEYSYQVSDDRWGLWFQRAVRVPTRRLTVRIDLPARLDPVVWGMETTISADALPFRTAISREDDGGRRVFSWATDNPPLHARYRLEWNFRAAVPDTHPAASPSEQMASVGVIQAGADILRQPARPFDLPDEAEDARRVVAQLFSAAERIASMHTFGKGMGIAAPQIGISRSAAIIRDVDGATITLLNPEVIELTPDIDEQFEGCLSFFDVRGLVPRPLAIRVAHTAIDGVRHITEFARGSARLVAHEIDHLNGQLYTDRMRPGVQPIPVEQYRGVGTRWTYPR